MPSFQRQHPVAVRLPTWGVFVAESIHATEFQPETMKHDYLKVIYVFHGEGVLYWDETPMPCEAGDVIAVPIGQTHRIQDTPGRPLTLYIVCIGAWLLEHGAQLVRDLSKERVTLDGLLSETVRSTLRRMLYEDALRPHGYKTMLQGLALQLLAQLARRLSTETGQITARHCRAVVKQYIKQLEGHFFESANLDAVARQLGMSRRRFTQLFRELTGDSWVNYLQRHRVEHAKHLLATTDRTILAIAFECGFQDPSTFYRAFQRHADCTPNAWRTASG